MLYGLYSPKPKGTLAPRARDCISHTALYTSRYCMRFTITAKPSNTLTMGYIHIHKNSSTHTHNRDSYMVLSEGGGGGSHLTPYFKDTRVTRQSGGMIIPNMRFLHSLKLILTPFWSEVSFFFSHFVWCLLWLLRQSGQ